MAMFDWPLGHPLLYHPWICPQPALVQSREYLYGRLSDSPRQAVGGPPGQ
ncbi:hypothetical protein FEAC_05310 [Ferrimicrobium acidiphilum DSM 19497]|uniref:Uncharacterized protein n=1 Tax=Ferrimicrobium acidiphilum DSM 19497 TaxID=1121877 RepID=A0A0D8FYS5_9ACTN|nr:hypothetical protein FEAC_05310 [Ferrimicrobium acidiphilum DSM 19497]